MRRRSEAASLGRRSLPHWDRQDAGPQPAAGCSAGAVRRGFTGREASREPIGERNPGRTGPHPSPRLRRALRRHPPHLSGEYSVGTRNSDTTPVFSAVSDPPAVFSDASLAASHSGSCLKPAKLAFAASRLSWPSR